MREEYAHPSDTFGQRMRLALQDRDLARYTFGEQHPAYATSLDSLAVVYDLMGNYTEAMTLYREAGVIRRAALGEEHPAAIASLTNQALLYQSIGDYAAAEPLYHEISIRRRSMLGPTHPVYVTSLNHLAGLYKDMGNDSAAEQLYRQVCAIRRQLLGTEHPLYATSLSNLAQLYATRDEYAAAERLYRQASEIDRIALGEEHPVYATDLSNLAQLDAARGDYAEAERLYHQASDIDRLAFGACHPLYATGLTHLAQLYEARGDYAAAAQLAQQVCGILRDALGEHHLAYATSLQHLAQLHAARDDYATAVSLSRQALAIRRDLFGEQHPAYAASLHDLARLTSATGAYATAEALFRQALEILRATCGAQHPDYAASLHQLALLCAATSRPNEALALAQQAQAIQDQLIDSMGAIGTTAERHAYLAALTDERDSFLSLVSHLLPDRSEAARAACDLVLRRRALQHERDHAPQDAALCKRYPDLASQIHDRRTLRVQIARAMRNGPGHEQPSAYRKRLASWRARLERMEAHLVTHIPELRLLQQQRAADHRTVVAQLPANATFALVTRYAVFDFTAVPACGEPRWPISRYLAFVLPVAAPDDLRIIDLGPAPLIDQQIATCYPADDGQHSTRLHQLFCTLLRPALPETGALVLSFDSAPQAPTLAAWPLDDPAQQDAHELILRECGVGALD